MDFGNPPVVAKKIRVSTERLIEKKVNAGSGKGVGNARIRDGCPSGKSWDNASDLLRAAASR